MMKSDWGICGISGSALVAAGARPDEALVWVCAARQAKAIPSNAIARVSGFPSGRGERGFIGRNRGLMTGWF